MAREILFKAKRKDNGEWVEGYFVKGKFYYDEREMAVILPIDLCFYPRCEITEWFEVDINTLCQYTGLTDKNGNKIWEKDVVQHDFGNGYGSGDGIGIQKAIIQYSKEYHSFLMKPINDWQYAHLQDCEVIGNIFDTELLGGGE